MAMYLNRWGNCSGSCTNSLMVSQLEERAWAGEMSRVRADLREGRTPYFFSSAGTPRSPPPLLGAVLERGSARQAPAMFPVGMALHSPTPSKWLPSPWPLG